MFPQPIVGDLGLISLVNLGLDKPELAGTELLTNTGAHISYPRCDLGAV